jgi:hypothetical protein
MLFELCKFTNTEGRYVSQLHKDYFNTTLATIYKIVVKLYLFLLQIPNCSS